jgi:hypothetical protein
MGFRFKSKKRNRNSISPLPWSFRGDSRGNVVATDKKDKGSCRPVLDVVLARLQTYDARRKRGCALVQPGLWTGETVDSVLLELSRSRCACAMSFNA